ncbi:MAG: glycosyltransferase [Planctomycetota bacterium]|jgi:glycosyltransferase involved in cell wall biosynthesis
MHNRQEHNNHKTLLVFNCHEAWVYQLGVLGYALDIIVGLKGSYKQTWDEQMRPVPPNSRLITLPEALESQTRYYCIITHNIADLLDIKFRPEPRLMVIHSTLEGRVLEEKSNITPERMREMLHQYIDLTGVHAVAVSELKGKSCGFIEDIVPLVVGENDYLPYSGHLAMGLRISNFIESRKKILLWDFHEKAFDGIPVRLVGHNPDIPGVNAAENWDDLKRILQSHRFYIHTARPGLEDGYNTASLEAMASGMPILGNRHPGSPIEHGVSGFLSDDPDELRKYAGLLLEDRDLAAKMGRKARKPLIEHFSLSRFKEDFLKSIETARSKWESRKVQSGKV